MNNHPLEYQPIPDRASHPMMRFKILVTNVCGIVLGACLFLLAAILLCNLFAAIWVLIGFTVEKTVVFLFGRQVYREFFPVCSLTTYNAANGCYVTNSVYCH
jgi:hypothetical protein